MAGLVGRSIEMLHAASVHTERHANRHTGRLKRHVGRHGDKWPCHRMGETVTAGFDWACEEVDRVSGAAALRAACQACSLWFN
jgi:hypothetical protein